MSVHQQGRLVISCNDLRHQNGSGPIRAGRWDVDINRGESDTVQIFFGQLKNFLHVCRRGPVACKFIDVETAAIDAHHLFHKAHMPLNSIRTDLKGTAGAFVPLIQSHDGYSLSLCREKDCSLYQNGFII